MNNNMNLMNDDNDCYSTSSSCGSSSIHSDDSSLPVIDMAQVRLMQVPHRISYSSRPFESRREKRQCGVPLEVQGQEVIVDLTLDDDDEDDESTPVMQDILRKGQPRFAAALETSDLVSQQQEQQKSQEPRNAAKESAGVPGTATVKPCPVSTTVPHRGGIDPVHELNQHDVLCGHGGPGSIIYNHDGNVLLRKMVAARKSEYVSLPKLKKRIVADEIVKTIRIKGGRFLDTGKEPLDDRAWYDIGDERAIMKVREALRNAARGCTLPNTLQEDNTLELEMSPGPTLDYPYTKNPTSSKPYPISTVIPPRGIGPVNLPNHHDVLCGRGIINHPGNVILRKLVRAHTSDYLSLPTSKQGKTLIAAGILQFIRCMEPAGRFLKRDPVDRAWYDIGDDKAIEKVLYALQHDYKKEECLLSPNQVLDQSEPLEVWLQKKHESMVPPRGIGPVYEPIKHDVLYVGCHINHPGNAFLRELVAVRKSEFLSQSTRVWFVAAEIVQVIRQAGRFLKKDPQDDGAWYDIGDVMAIKIIGDSLYHFHCKRREAVGHPILSPRQEAAVVFNHHSTIIEPQRRQQEQQQQPTGAHESGGCFGGDGGDASSSKTCPSTSSVNSKETPSSVSVLANDADRETSPSWEDYYLQLVFFKVTQGHTNVPLDYKDGKSKPHQSLAQWVLQQRAQLLWASLQAEEKKKKLAPYLQLRIHKLKAIGFELSCYSNIRNNDDVDDQQHERTPHHQQGTCGSSVLPAATEVATDGDGHDNDMDDDDDDDDGNMSDTPQQPAITLPTTRHANLDDPKTPIRNKQHPTSNFVPPRGTTAELINKPNHNDVLCIGIIIDHPGNHQFLQLVASHMPDYLPGRTKRKVAAGIVQVIRHMEPAGRFLRKDSEGGSWYDIGDAQAINKVHRALYDSYKRQASVESPDMSPTALATMDQSETTASQEGPQQIRYESTVKPCPVPPRGIGPVYEPNEIDILCVSHPVDHPGNKDDLEKAEELPADHGNRWDATKSSDGKTNETDCSSPPELDTSEYTIFKSTSNFEMLSGNRDNAQFGYHTSSYQMAPNMWHGQQIKHQQPEPKQHRKQQQRQHQLEESARSHKKRRASSCSPSPSLSVSCARPHKKLRRSSRPSSISTSPPSLSPCTAIVDVQQTVVPSSTRNLFPNDDNRVDDDETKEVIVEIDI